MNDVVSHLSNCVENFPPKNSGPGDDRRTGVDPVCMGELVHELSQPLGAIDSLAYYLEIIEENERTRRNLQQIRVLVERASHILNRASAAA
jgi:hypothetical protein